MFDPLSLHYTKCKTIDICENEATINYHHCTEVKKICVDTVNTTVS